MKKNKCSSLLFTSLVLLILSWSNWVISIFKCVFCLLLSLDINYFNANGMRSKPNLEQACHLLLINGSVSSPTSNTLWRQKSSSSRIILEISNSFDKWKANVKLHVDYLTEDPYPSSRDWILCEDQHLKHCKAGSKVEVRMWLRYNCV